MYKGIVVSDNHQIREECTQVVETEKRIHLEFMQSVNVLENSENDYNALFVLIHDFANILPQHIKSINNKFPTASIIFYSPSFFTEQLMQLSRISEVHLIIGEDRKIILQNTLERLVNSHWRKIPLRAFAIEEKNLSQQILQAIHYIEENSFNLCTIPIVSSQLNLSPGYFSQKFKKETGYSFRGFIQRTLVYYEEEVLVNFNISAMQMAKLLGYSDLSSFSRSFKKRQGVAPTHYLKSTDAA